MNILYFNLWLNITHYESNSYIGMIMLRACDSLVKHSACVTFYLFHLNLTKKYYPNSSAHINFGNDKNNLIFRCVIYNISKAQFNIPHNSNRKYSSRCHVCLSIIWMEIIFDSLSYWTSIHYKNRSIFLLNWFHSYEITSMNYY